jgi:hypothetical protein
MTSHAVRRTLALLLFCSTAAPVYAQAPKPLVLTAANPFKGVKHQISLSLSGGFDLDVIGDVVNGGIGSQGDDAQLAIRAPQPWPEVYTSVPKRPELTIGYGFGQKHEVIVRLSRAHYTGEPFDAGNFVDRTGDRPLAVAVSPYDEKSWEIGLRKYLKMTRRVKQYFNVVYGNRMIEPMQAALLVDGEEPLNFRLYDRSKVKTFGLEVGLTIERGHAGVFVQVGARFVRRMKRNDEDLAVWDLQELNNTGVRFYMPLQFGFVVRLG